MMDVSDNALQLLSCGLKFATLPRAYRSDRQCKQEKVNTAVVFRVENSIGEPQPKGQNLS
jgi:hypothetical protein